MCVSASVKSQIIIINNVPKKKRKGKNLFGRFLWNSTMGKIDLERFLHQFHYHCHILMEAWKPLASQNHWDKLESNLEESNAPIDVGVCIVETTLILWCYAMWRDVYNTPSIKDAERQRLGSQSVLFGIKVKDQHRHRNWQYVLGSSC